MNLLSIREATTVAQLKSLHDSLPEAVARDIVGKPVMQVFSTLSEFHRAMFKKALYLADNLVGRQCSLARVPRFAFVMLGSGARSEQSIKSDQDHALIYDGINPEAQWQGYFEELTKLTSAMLHEIGYPLCTGNVMASNTRWRGTETQWQERLARYNEYPDWDHIRFLLIASDAEIICGDKRLVERLRGQAIQYIARSPFMRWKVADQGLSAKVALNVLGSIKTEILGDHRGALQIKEGLYTPLVNSVRLWALSVGIEDPTTWNRIDRLVSNKAWNDELAEDAKQALLTTLELRLKHHIQMALLGRSIDDYVEVESLSDGEREKLKRALRVVRQIQQLTARHFPKSG